MKGGLGEHETVFVNRNDDAEHTRSISRPLQLSRSKSTTVTTIEDRLLVSSLLGSGGEADVLAAEQVALGRTIAVKRARPGSQNQLLREARIAAKLAHPNILPIYDVRLMDGAPVVLMKLIEGETWSKKVKRGELSLAENLEIIGRVCDGVAFAHSKGVLHLDLKLSNVMLGDFGQVYVSDWGSAKQLAETAHLTEVVGTPAYMAPEMLKPDGDVQISERTDVYLLGAVLYHIAEGHAPHKADSVSAMCARAAVSDPSYSDSTPTGIVEICQRALAADPSDRYQSVIEFKKAVLDFMRARDAYALIETADNQTAVIEAASAEETVESEYLLARTLYLRALDMQPSSPEAIAGMRKLITCVVRHEVAAGNYQRAVDIAGSSPHADPVTAGFAKDSLAQEQKRIEERERLAEAARRADRGNARRGIVALGAFLFAFALLPQVARLFVEHRSMAVQGTVVIGLEAFILLIGYAIYREKMRDNRWIEYLFSCLALIVVVSAAGVACGSALNLSEDQTILTVVFGNSAILAAFAVLFDKRLLITAAVYFGLSIASISMTEELSTFLASARDFTLVLTAILVLRTVSARQTES